MHSRPETQGRRTRQRTLRMAKQGESKSTRTRHENAPVTLRIELQGKRTRTLGAKGLRQEVRTDRPEGTTERNQR
jgi:hypothetical protein